MPGLRDCDFQISYGPGDDRLNCFFIPALTASVRYDRAAGFFSSSMLAVAAAGLVRLIANGGKMRLLCGADLSAEDVEAVKKGHEELAEVVARRMKIRLALPEDDYVKNRVQALAWLVGTGQLEILVVLPKGPDGQPLPGAVAEAYYHPKEGVFTDAAGNKVAFSGSVNESATALVENYETFLVVTSWQTPPYVATIQTRFEKLWSGKDPDWIALPIPEAAKRELLKLRPVAAPTHDALEPPPPEPEKVPPPTEGDPAAQRERIVFQFLRDAPKLIGSGPLGAATSTVTLWPHQERVVKAVVERFPFPAMLCDEVGLGKTIEAGLVLRELLLSGQVKRALVLVPKSVLKQWQEELYEKFSLNILRYDGQTLRDVFDRETKPPAGTNPWNSRPVLLASSHLAKRRERQQQLVDADGWDLLLIDEAHHARRKDMLSREQFRPNRLLELLVGTHQVPGLKDKVRGLILLTATPMQIDPVEVWDLLKVLGLGGRWGAGEANFLRYFDELRRPVGEADWAFMAAMLRDYFAAGGAWDESFCQVAERKIGPAAWDQVKGFPYANNPGLVVRRLPAEAQAVVQALARRHTPLRRYIFRNTRELMRVYRQKGLLKENIPFRDPSQVWIELRPDEWELYQRIEQYIRHHYQKYEAERKGLGFIMTVYRRRLTSSFYAIAQSLQRRLDFLKGKLRLDQMLTDDDAEQEELDQDVGESLFAGTTADERREIIDLCQDEIDYLDDFLTQLRSLGTDSKFERLAADLRDVLQKRDSVLVFTQYTDTMDYVRDRLREVYGGQVACYSGRGGERWQGGKWVVVSKETIKTAFRSSREVKILLCTESASEGLNLQTCGVLINYDMPWNPMRVEQRIGRIDRIGQTYERVWVRNYFYEGTVEADIYHRLDDRIGSFEHVVGELQPILARVGRLIEEAVMAGADRREQLISQTVASINQDVRSAEVGALNLDRLVDDDVAAANVAPPPVTMLELERVLVESAALKGRLHPHPTIRGAHQLDWEGQMQGVTFDPVVFDEHPNTLRLMTYGGELLEAVLGSVEPPCQATAGGRVARCWTDSSPERVGWYALDDGSATPIRTLSRLRDALGAPGQNSGITDAALAAARRRFDEELAPLRRQEANHTLALKRDRAAALAEEIRDLLVQAAYVELARASADGVFASEGAAGFSVETVQRLRRHKFPFAGALKAVAVDGLTLSPTDPRYLRTVQGRGDALDRRFDAIKVRLSELLTQYVAALPEENPSLPPAPAERAIRVVLYGAG